MSDLTRMLVFGLCLIVVMYGMGLGLLWLMFHLAGMA